jgi:uncharacterized membrane protein YecN with MAPEG domain
LPLTVTPLYAGLLAALFLVLSLRVIIYRRRNKVPYGGDGKLRFTGMIRAQANCAEYAPIGLILLLVAELNGVGLGWLHLVGLTLTAGRVMHGVGLSFLQRCSPCASGACC